MQESLGDIPLQALVVSVVVVRVVNPNSIHDDLELWSRLKPFFEFNVCKVKWRSPLVVLLLDHLQNVRTLIHILHSNHKQCSIFRDVVVLKFVFWVVSHSIEVFKGCSNEFLHFSYRKESFLPVEVVHHWNIFVLIVEQKLFVPHELLGPQLALRILYRRAHQNTHQNE